MERKSRRLAEQHKVDILHIGGNILYQNMFRLPLHPEPNGVLTQNNNLYPQQQALGGMASEETFVPLAFPMHRREREFHPPFHKRPTTYHIFPPFGSSRLSPLMRPPPPPGSPPMESPPPPPPVDGTGSVRPTPKSAPPPPPPMPKDPEMLKNIDILSSFVVKNGPQFENMARAKQAGDPKFAFLFGGDQGSDAAFGYDFYNWKKEHLMWVEERARGASPLVDQSQHPNTTFEQTNLQGKNEGPIVGAEISHDSPNSLVGSDMDMEDDFALLDLANEKNTYLDKTPIIPSPVVGRKLGQSPTQIERGVGVSSLALEWKPDCSSSSHETRLPSLVVALEREVIGDELVESKVGSQLDQDCTQSGNGLGIGMQSNSQGGKAPRATTMTKFQRDTSSADVQGRRDTQRQTHFDQPCMKDISGQSNIVRTRQKRESLPTLNSSRKGTFGNGHREVPRRPHWCSELSFERRGNGFSNFDKVVDRLQSPNVGAKQVHSHDDGNLNQSEQLKPKPRLDQPVDEFGRLIQKGGSDSDRDDDRYGEKKKQKSALSKSRSRSPRDTRLKYWSLDQSPYKWGRRSRSWSHSPRRNRSCSLTPPRDGRRGGEERGDCGGQRGGKGGGGTIPTCYDYLKGRCSRGPSCRFSHDDNHGGQGNPGGKKNGGRGQLREHSQSGKVGEEVKRNWGGRSGDDTKHWRPWKSNECSSMEKRESKFIAELKKQGQVHGASIDEPLKQHNKDCDIPSKLIEKPGQTGNCKQVVTSSQMVITTHAPSSTTPSTTQLETSLPLGSLSQVSQKMSVSQNQLLSQQSSLDGSPTSHSEQLHFSFALTHAQQNSISTMSEFQKPGKHPLPTLSHISNSNSNALHEQFTTRENSLSSSSPSLQALPPPFAPISQSQTSFSVPPHPNSTQFSHHNGQGNVWFRPNMVGGQPQMSQSPVLQTFPPRPLLAWIPGPAPCYSLAPSQPLQQPSQSLQMPIHPVTQPPMSLQMAMYPLQQPLHSFQDPIQPFQQPPHSLQQPMLSLQQPPHSIQRPIQPLHQSPSHSLPPEFYTTTSGVYPYGGYPMPLYSKVTSNEAHVQPQPPIKGQYDPLPNSLEPAPPGSSDKKGVVSQNQSLSHENSTKEEQWKQNPGDMGAPLMTNVGEVVLENVSPGLPSHVESVGRGSEMMGRASPIQQPSMAMENVSSKVVGNSLNVQASMKLGGLQQRELMENVSPLDEKNKDNGDGGKQLTFKMKERRVLSLIRKEVAEQVKYALKPTWKGGHITKEAFKTIAKKVVYKVMGALEIKGVIPNSQEKVDLFMKISKPKIVKLVQGYVDKYSK